MSGVILGRSKESGELIRHKGEAHLITFAATGKGKTSGPVITNARTYEGSLLAIDVKGEIHRESAHYRRAMGQSVHVIDLSDEPFGADCLNPCDIGRRLGSDMMSVARGMAKEIAPMTLRDPFWSHWSANLIQAQLSHVMMSHPEKATLHHLYQRYVDDDPIHSLATTLDKEPLMNTVSYRTWGSFINLVDVTRSGVLATVIADVEIFGTTLAKRVTDNTSFDLDGLVEGRPMTVYFIVPPDRIKAFAPVLRLWFSMLMLLFTKRRTRLDCPTLFLLDEAAQLGRMDSLLTAMTLLRSYSFRVWSMWQSASQLRLYGDDMETLTLPPEMPPF